MPDHVHVVIRKYRDHAEDMITNLKAASLAKLNEAGVRAPTHPVWGGPGWKRFLYTRADLVRIIDQIRMNSIKAGSPAQPWSFVRPNDGWLPGRWRAGSPMTECGAK